jgi:hypothetical protein
MPWRVQVYTKFRCRPAPSPSPALGVFRPYVVPHRLPGAAVQEIPVSSAPPLSAPIITAYKIFRSPESGNTNALVRTEVHEFPVPTAPALCLGRRVQEIPVSLNDTASALIRAGVHGTPLSVAPPLNALIITAYKIFRLPESGVSNALVRRGVHEIPVHLAAMAPALIRIGVQIGAVGASSIWCHVHLRTGNSGLPVLWGRKRPGTLMRTRNSGCFGVCSF